MIQLFSGSNSGGHLHSRRTPFGIRKRTHCIGRGPGDPATPGTRGCPQTRRGYPSECTTAMPYRIILFLISVPVIALEIYSIYDPREAYLLFRRGLKYADDVQLTDFYLSLTRYGAVAGLILYSLFLIAAGETAVLLAALFAVTLLYLLLRRPAFIHGGHGFRPGQIDGSARCTGRGVLL